jgi:sarcosine oxidase
VTATTFDVIVIGLGGMGAASALELSRRGLQVLGLEQHQVGHDQGSSHGHSRIIRQAYYEDPAYVPLARRAYELWYDLEQRQGEHLLTICPCLSIGRPETPTITGVRSSAAEHGLPIEDLSADDLRRRYPQFQFEDEYVGVLDGSAGFLYVDTCVAALAAEASRLGARLIEGEAVVGWKPSGAGVEVATERAKYSAQHLVLAAGPWSGSLLRDANVPLTVMRQTPMWFGTSNDRQFGRDRFPTFMAETPEGYFYGLPALDRNGLKVARHYGAEEMSSPLQIERTTTEADEQPLRGFLNRHIPEANGPRRRASVCIYTLTPDRHFILDRHPRHPQVAVAAGFSGHGFKFATVVGESMAELVVDGRTSLGTERFRIDRFEAAEREVGRST